jgi:DNA invertase Pin-like site-specific DNA recombinase
MLNQVNHASSTDYAYIRISGKDQHEDRQLAALAPYNIPKRNIYFDTQSGKDFKRPKYKRLMRKIKAGDMLYIKSIDRLGRNYGEIIEQWKIITKQKCVDIKVLDMPLLDTTYCKDLLGTLISDIVLQVLSFSAQMERETMLQRQAEGIAAAKAKGVKFGRKPSALPDNFDEIIKQWRSGERTGEETANLCGICLKTLYNKVSAMIEVEND